MPDFGALSTADFATLALQQTFTDSQTFTKSVVLNGGFNMEMVSKTANYTLTSDDGIVHADATGSSFTLTLPAAASNMNKVYIISRIDVIASTNLVTIDPNGSETIDGMANWKLYPDEKITIMSDGTNWMTLQRENPDFLGSFFLKGATSNRRYVAGMMDFNTSLLTSTTAPAANTLWAMPLFLSKTVKMDTISFEITTAQASQNSNAGIYYDNGNAYPGALIFNTGSVSTGTTGVKNTTITAGLQTFQPGLYWLAYESSATTSQIRILPSASTCIGFAGYASTMGTVGQGFAYSVADTYGATLPDPYPGSATLITTPSAATTPIPAVAVRII